MSIRFLVQGLILSSMTFTATAQAVHVAGDSALRGQTQPSEAQASNLVRDDSNALATGVIDTVDAAAGSVVIHGVLLRFDPSSVLVFSARGTPLSVSALQSHQSVGFLLDRTDSKHPAIRVFYLK